MDGRLAQRCREGDPDAFADLVAVTGQLTYRWAHRLAGNRDDALDMAQEAYTAVWQALPGLREPNAFRTWFLRVVGNAYRDWLRRRRRTPAPAAAPADGERQPLLTAPNSGPQPDEQVLVRDTQAAVQAAVRSLPPIYAVTVTLHYLEGLAYRELAAAMGVSERTVETRLRRAREMLRRRLAAQAEWPADHAERSKRPPPAEGRRPQRREVNRHDGTGVQRRPAPPQRLD